MQSVEPVLENAIKTLQKVVDVRGMGKKWARSWPHQSSRQQRICRDQVGRDPQERALKYRPPSEVWFRSLMIYKYVFKNLRNKMLRFKIMSSHSTFCFHFTHYYNIKLYIFLTVDIYFFSAYLLALPSAGTGGGSRSSDVHRTGNRVGVRERHKSDQSR